MAVVLWQLYEYYYFDVHIFNPHAHSHQQSSLKNCAYEQRVREVKPSPLIPLVLSATGEISYDLL